MATPKCCEGCVKWEKFGRECWVYWEEKKNCTQHNRDRSEFALQ